MSRSDSVSRIEDAVSAFRDGDPVLIHDAADREGEVDLIYPAEAVTPDAVVRLRNDAGGLVCVALAEKVADAFELPFVVDAIDHQAADHDHLGYDERSSFSFSVNHRETYTGITDRDRALTISELGRAAVNPESFDFSTAFRAPGHVHLLRAAPTLADRQGHTELAVALAEEADIAPAVVVCEMLDDETGEARSVADAKTYAERNDFVYVEGSDLLDAFEYR